MPLPVLFFYGFAFIGIIYSVIFLIVAFRNKKIDDFIITVFLFAQSIIILEYVIYWLGKSLTFPYFNYFSLPLLLLFGPLLFIYTDIIFTEKRKLSSYFLHFLPSIVVFIYLIPFYTLAYRIRLIPIKRLNYDLPLNTLPYLIMASMLLYFVMIFVKIFQQKQIGYIKQWLVALNILFGIYIFCYIFYFFAITQSWYSLKTDYFVNLSTCASIVLIIYFSYRKKQIFDGFSMNEVVGFGKGFQSKKIDEKGSFVKYKNSGLTEKSRFEISNSLENLMKKEKHYRESELKLETLAQKLGVERHIISQVINQNFGVNFFEYINQLRIEEAKELLKSSENLTIIEIAYQVGYSTKSTFNTAFRRIVGVTPSEYRNTNL